MAEKLLRVPHLSRRATGGVFLILALRRNLRDVVHL